ncbi:signal transduction histidine kinase [Streptomyces sp. Amel2xB2]|uniref:sensor histidine kinase n=1 Tax=Streptomyces sp. Amel2xB2 TaxID=1305829 RepID=UPI000DB94944|nr:ATP-binding protein [Streptomyces sp. Amel2xB2]RAJ69041.1 signal transduction histidine kinase [Streptomyces sp. Amel2xB2]
MTPETSPPSKRSAHGAATATSGRPPKKPRTGTGTALALLIAVLVTGPACLLAVYAAPQSVRPGIAWGSGIAAVLLSVAVALATRGILLAQGLRAVVRQQEADSDAEKAVAAHFADVIVPILVERLRSGASAQTALAAVPTVANPTHQRVLHSLANEVHRGEGMRAAAMAACANAAGRVQALATSMAADLREMEHKYSDEEVLGDLLHLDHRTAQTGRLADSIAVLTGARTGRRWAKPIVMESILRGAMGRISGYQRIRLHSSCELAVAGHAAEGVMHALAELMDNAANFSPPTSEVHVYVEEASAGVIITVEDGGLTMGDVALERAQQAVSSESLDLTNLSGTRLGLAVVGRLAHKHDLSVSFRPSAHGGTGVLLMVPQSLITQPKRETESPAPAREVGESTGPRPSAPASVPASTGGASTEATATPSVPAPRSAPSGGPRPSEPVSQPAAETSLRGGEPQRASQLPRRRRPSAAPDGDDTGAGSTSGTAGAGSAGSGTGTAAADASPSGNGAAFASPETPAEPSPEHSSATESGPSGLPKRRRGQTLAAARQRSAAAESGRTPEPARTAEQSGSRFGAFRRAVQGGSTAQESAQEQKPDDDASSTSPSPSSSRPEDNTE